MRTTFIHALILLPTLIIAGCTSGIDPGPCRTADCQPASYQFSITRYTHQQGDTTMRSLVADARFEPYHEDLPSSVAASAGRVSINDIRLREIQVIGPPPSYRYSFADTRDTGVLAAPGAANTWRVTGSEEVIPMVLTIESPRIPLAFITPEVDDTIDVDSSLELRWTLPDPADRSHTNPMITLILDDADAGGSFVFSRAITDSGAISLPLDSLRSWHFPRGPLIVNIQRATSHSGLAPDGRVYITTIAEVTSERFFLRY